MATMDNPTDALFQLPSILDQVNLNEIETEEEEHQFVPSSYKGHDENLAEVLPDATLNKISASLMSAIEDDILSRKEWEDTLKDGLEQTGLKIEKDKEFPFNNACGIYSPIMMRVVTEFYSAAIQELLPIEGPVKELILGEVTDELEEQASKVEKWTNIFFTQEATEYYPDFKKMIMWLGIAGKTIKKTYFDPRLNRPTSPFIRPQDFIVNYGTTDLETCWRMTECVTMDEMIFKDRQEKGIYRNIALAPDETQDQVSDLQNAVDKTEGVTNPDYDQNVNYNLYESHVYLDFEEIENEDMNGEDNEDDDDQEITNNFRPYIVTLHKESEKILRIERNWEEDDKDFRRIEYYTDYGYLQGLGFYSYGAAHLIGGLANACTALLRQTIDGQTLANFPGGLRQKGMRLVDNNIRIGPTEFIEVDTGGARIQDAVMTMPYNEPSPNINILRNELEEAASGIMGAANMQVSDLNQNTPVGTTYALLGSLHKVQSTVIRSIRDSMTKEIKKFYRLFAKHLPDVDYQFDTIGGSFCISRYDFIDQISMVPVADAHVTTDMQRLFRAQTLESYAGQNPNLYDLYEVHHMLCKAMKLTDSQIEKILPPKDDVMPLDPITENRNIMQGKAVKASIEQDHQSHMVVHNILINDPQTPPEVAAEAMSHIAVHKSFEFLIQMQQMIGAQLPEDPAELPMELQNQIAMAAAQALMQQQQQQEQEAPPAPLDPAAVMLEDVKTKKEIAELKAQVDAFKAQLMADTKNKEMDVKIQEIEQNAKTQAFKTQMEYEMTNKKIESEQNTI